MSTLDDAIGALREHEHARVEHVEITLREYASVVRLSRDYVRSLGIEPPYEADTYLCRNSISGLHVIDERPCTHARQRPLRCDLHERCSAVVCCDCSALIHP